MERRGGEGMKLEGEEEGMAREMEREMGGDEWRGRGWK